VQGGLDFNWLWRVSTCTDQLTFRDPNSQVMLPDIDEELDVDGKTEPLNV